MFRKLFGRKQARNEAAELAQMEQVMKSILVREPVTGPGARPWKERRTIKPDGYQSQQWGSRWTFAEPNEARLIPLPEECVGTIFPDDTVEINGRIWKVVQIHSDHDWPIAEVLLIQ